MWFVRVEIEQYCDAYYVEEDHGKVPLVIEHRYPIEYYEEFYEC